MKRALDLLVASIALVALAPVFGLIAALVKLDSRGPVFVTQVRFRRNGHHFLLPRFRTMHAGGPRLAALMGQALLDDARMTRVGRFLRRFDLDELPTLWSVLIGDMTLGGPRPLMAHEIGGHLARKPRRFAGRHRVTRLWGSSSDFER